jgi:phytanoyl-CoA hydroxylase
MQCVTFKTHLPGLNRTDNFRKAISCHYASSDCHYIDVRGTSQENISQEVENVAKRRGITNLPFEQIWHAKSRRVRGSPGKL